MTNREQIKAYITPAEKQEVTTLADQAQISVSELVRRLILGQKLPDTNRHLDVIDLVRVNADLARLGNLFTMALKDEEFIPPPGVDLDSLIVDIRETQSILKTKIKEL